MTDFITFTISRDPSFIGPDATLADDLEAFAENLAAELKARYGQPVTILWGESSNWLTSDVPEVNAWLKEISRSEEWRCFL